MRKLPFAISLLLLAPALAGCLQDDAADPDGEGAAVAASADEAGAVSGPAPAAPRTAYRVEGAEGSGEATAYPVALVSNPAKPPVTHTFEGVFEPAQCSPLGNVDPRTSGWRYQPIHDGLDEGDVFSYSLQLTFENTDESWAELHLYYGIGSKGGGWNEPVMEQRGTIVQNFTGQSYRVDDDDPAWAAVSCWYGMITEPIEYTLTVTYTFAENAVPAEVPVLLRVPEGATRLFVTSVPVDPNDGVQSHYRIFGPDDALLCECALGSNARTSSFPLETGPGDYVVLVDHTSNGFVSLALDVPSVESLRPLSPMYVRVPLLTADGGAVDERVELDLPRVPLGMGVWYMPDDEQPLDAGGAKQTHVRVENARGEVFRMAQAGFLQFRAQAGPMGWQMWMGAPLPGDWDWHVDHHAFDRGTHVVEVKAEAYRGEVYFWYVTYDRS